jgi:hypothetical protein
LFILDKPLIYLPKIKIIIIIRGIEDDLNGVTRMDQNLGAPLTVDFIFADDQQHTPRERSLPWEEKRGGVTVVVEPLQHCWAEDMRAFHDSDRKYCYYADWIKYGPRARFFNHPETRGDDVMMKARAMIAREITDGLWH